MNPSKELKMRQNQKNVNKTLGDFNRNILI